MLKSFWFPLIFLLATLLSSCQEKVEIVTLRGQTMGTTYTVKFFADDKDFPIKKLHTLIDIRLRQVNQEMSTYIKDSRISLFNETRSVDWVEVPKDFFHVVEHALQVARLTNGVFDPTIGPLVNLWGFGPDGERKVPDPEKIREVRNHVGYWHVALNKEKKQMKKLIPELYLDLSASAKGFGVDTVATILRKNGIENYMVEIGGEIVTRGMKPSGPWKVAIESPNPAEQRKPYEKVLELSNLAMATSGSYRNFFEAKGKKYSHTIDYRTGKPIDHRLVSVTVLSPESTMIADSWATALMALGSERGLELAKKIDLAAYFIYQDHENVFVSKKTDAFDQLLSKKAQGL